MNKTLRMLLLMKKLKRIKPTYLNWKTFNAKQTWIHIPKVLNILKKINNTMLTACKKQIKVQQNSLVAATNQTNNISYTYKNNNLTTKHIVFSSIFATKNKKINNKIEVQVKTQNALKISMQYIMHMLLLNMYDNLKKTKNNVVTLPRKSTLYTLLKSPHADKKAREQFMKELYNVRISLQNYVATMQYMNSIVLSYTKAFIHSYKYNAFYENKI
jgi:ribosomal protein S10